MFYELAKESKIIFWKRFEQFLDFAKINHLTEKVPGLLLTGKLLKIQFLKKREWKNHAFFWLNNIFS